MQTPTDVFRRRLVTVRRARGFTNQAQLAQRLAELGQPIHETAVARIESGARDVKLDEAVAIAAALGVPLPLLVLPLDTGDEVALAPELAVGAWRAFEWFVCREPLGDVEAFAWSTMLVWAYERLMAAQDAARTALYRLESAEVLGWAPDVQVAAYVDALRDVATAVRDLEEAGGRPKPLLDRRVARALRDRKVAPRPRRVVRFTEES